MRRRRRKTNKPHCRSFSPRPPGLRAPDGLDRNRNSTAAAYSQAPTWLPGRSLPVWCPHRVLHFQALVLPEPVQDEGRPKQGSCREQERRHVYCHLSCQPAKGVANRLSSLRRMSCRACSPALVYRLCTARRCGGLAEAEDGSERPRAVRKQRNTVLARRDDA